MTDGWTNGRSSRPVLHYRCVNRLDSVASQLGNVGRSEGRDTVPYLAKKEEEEEAIVIT